ncbi:MAG: EAL domain-containing protein [Epsilonproteobacteria bacterium]|nr:EAL domain-containing protein [Campylobacterota bacterium]
MISKKDILKELKKLKVLFVEDDPVTREYGFNLFKDIFAEIDVAKDGREAIKKIQNKHYDLVITDLNMPGIDGFGVLKFVKRNFPHTFVIILSANFTKENLLNAITLGADGFLAKPFDMEKFTEIMKNIFYYKFKLDEELNILRQYKDIVDEDLIVSKTDLQGNITYVNRSFEEISGYSKEELLGKPHSIVRHPDMKSETFEELWNTILNKKVWRGVVKNRKKSGESYYVDSIIKPIIDRDGNIKEFIALRKEITNYISAEKLINDKLQLIDEALLVLVLIENFNDTNLVYEEDIIEKFRNKLLLRVKNLLKEKLNLKKKDIEDYIVKDDVLGFFIEKYNKDELEKIMNEVVTQTNSLPIVVNDFEFYPFIKISYAYGNHHLYKNAQIGLEELKKSEEKVIFANGLCAKKKVEIIKNMNMLRTIEEALRDNRVISYFQPIVDNKTKEYIKYESLVRIQDTNGEIISPYFFLDIAKKAGLYEKITQRVLENTFKVMVEKNIAVSINLAPSDIIKENIREQIYSFLHDLKPKKGMVTFELLEDEIIKFPKTLREFVDRILELNATIAIDDFGSGYSNFIRVVEVKAEIIKIDGTLIKDINVDKTKQDIVEAIVNFAKKENKKSVAEFVENEEIYNKLVELGVDCSQGYYFSKPLEAKDIL